MERKYLLILGIISVAFIIRLLPYSQAFTKKFDFSAVEKTYQQSQFAQDPADRKLTIKDWDTYSYAGLIYLT